VIVGLGLIKRGGLSIDQNILHLDPVGRTAPVSIIIPDARGRLTGGRNTERSPDVEKLEKDDLALEVPQAHGLARGYDLSLIVGESSAGKQGEVVNDLANLIGGRQRRQRRQ